ncbi:BgTH12-06986 [Blumeria graminis f. sp. triticale]|uniref:BgtA-21395 n=3 Tax=Blumeria graminis TaxID=34373 RepID=A0A9X9MP98_BLUGR|nr:hypothetical protein BGT96224_A21395 [Blumeria graminis f. sp. tritici 96224]CAD6506054.1 BgTH12-06986 [Blumeria graminis f. sp. triticale]VDB94702.1 BgtA-21395 [Blumeria graminis f. sp. tritici]
MESPTSEASFDSQVIRELRSSKTPSKFYQLHDVIKNSDNASENLYVVEEVTVLFLSNNAPRANILTQTKSNRKLRLQGRIVVDNDQEDHLIVYQDGSTLNGEWIIHEGDFSSFSIAFPNTLWVPTHLGHLEIRTSREYHEIFTEMMHAIGIFYVALFHYEEYGSEDGYSIDYNHMTAILNFYTVRVDGRGLFFKNAIDIAIKYSTFMLNEYSKEKAKGSLLGNHMFFNWLRDGCKLHHGIPVARTECIDMSPDQFRNYFKKARMRLKREYNTPEPSISQPIHEIDDSPFTPQITPATPSILSLNKPFHGRYESPQFPNGIQIDSSIPEKIAALICHAVASGRQQLSKLTISKIASALHRDYSVCYRNVCLELVIIYRSSILSFLPNSPPWCTSELYQELSSSKYSSAISSSHHFYKKMQESIRDYVSGTKILIHRENKFPNSSQISATVDTIKTLPNTSNSVSMSFEKSIFTSNIKTQQPLPKFEVPVLPPLPNRDPSIISLGTSAPDEHPKKKFGILRASYGSLGMYD